MNVLLFHTLLPLLGVASFIFACFFIKPTTKTWFKILVFGSVTGILNFFVDIVQQNLGFWHYTLNNPYGYPLSLYVAVSFFAATLALFYWRFVLYTKHSVFISLLLTTLYLVIQDYVFITLTGDTVVIFDSSHWWASDILSLSVIVWGTFFTYKFFVFSKIPKSTITK